MGLEKAMASSGPSSYVGTTSMRSLVSNRTTRSTKSSKSLKNLKYGRYLTPFLQPFASINVQRGSALAAAYTMFLSLFTTTTAIFDIYVLCMVERGVTHYGYYLFSFEFVYVGNDHVRNFLILFSLTSLMLGFVLFIVTIIFLRGLQKEVEGKLVPWLYVMVIFTLYRLAVIIFSSLVNDLIYGYHMGMLLLWLFFTVLNTFCWFLVYSFYLQLLDLTSLEDYAKYKLGTMGSLNASASHHSVYTGGSSRPTTPRGSLSGGGYL